MPMATILLLIGYAYLSSQAASTNKPPALIVPSPSPMYRDGVRSRAAWRQWMGGAADAGTHSNSPTPPLAQSLTALSNETISVCSVR